MYTVEQRGFLVRKYWQTGSFKACQMAFRTEFSERRAPSKCCIQKLVKKVRDKGEADLTPADFFLWGPTEGQSVQKYTPHNRTTQRRYTPRDSSRQRRHFGKSIPEFGETHLSVLGCESRFKPSMSTLWERYSRIWRNAFKCAWMWKETSFSIDCEQVLFCIVPGMCI